MGQFVGRARKQESVGNLWSQLGLSSAGGAGNELSARSGLVRRIHSAKGDGRRFVIFRCLDSLALRRERRDLQVQVEGEGEKGEAKQNEGKGKGSAERL